MILYYWITTHWLLGLFINALAAKWVEVMEPFKAGKSTLVTHSFLSFIT